MADSGIEGYASPAQGGSVRALQRILPRRHGPRLDTLGVQTTLLFGLLLLLQITCGVLAPWGVSLGSSWDYVHMATMGASLAPPTLLALWAVFGPQRVAVRLPLALWLTTIMYLATAYGEKRNSGELTNGLLVGTAWLATFLLIQLPLWLLRAVRRWRLTATADEPVATGAHAHRCNESLPSGQFTLRALLGWILAAAVSLAALRCLSPTTNFDAAELLLMAEAGFVGALIALPGLPIVALAWILLADGRRVVLRTTLCVLTLVGLAIGLWVVWVSAPDIEEVCALASVEAGTILIGLVTLSVVRACGYRLRRRPKQADAVTRLQGSSAHVPLSRWRFVVAAAPMLAIAAVLACSTPERFEIWRRADVTARWRERGVQVVFDDDGRITSAQCRSKTLSDDELRSIVDLADLESLDLNGTSLNHRQLALLAPLVGLRSLTLSHTHVTDSDLKHLVHFPELSFLDLTGTAVTDAGMKRLTRLRKLRALHLNITELSDAGLATLAEVPQLQVLEAELTAVSKTGAASFLKKRPRAQLTYGATDSLLARSLYVRKEMYKYLGMGARSIGIAQIPLKLKRLHARGKVIVNGAKSTVTNAGLASLVDQAEREELDLRESGVTDQGLTAISKLKSLKRLGCAGHGGHRARRRPVGAGAAGLPSIAVVGRCRLRLGRQKDG